MPQIWKRWSHVTKLDPDRVLGTGEIERIVTSGTDALMLSGTLNVTAENMRILKEQVSWYGLPLVVEPAGPEGVLFDGIDWLFVPSVLNTPDAGWIVGKHQVWARDHKISWEKVVPEAYIVLNPESAVGKVTRADCSLGARDVSAFAEVAEQYFGFPIVYIEYSGRYGNPDILKAVSETLRRSVLYYGGGIDSAERAAEMAKFADTIVVGNAVYEKGADVLRATVRAVK